MLVNPSVVDVFKAEIEQTRLKLDELIEKSKKDLHIDEIDLEQTLLRLPKMQSDYLSMYAKETVKLKDLYSLKEKIKLERWKYWSGKQTDKYYKENGIVHEKVLKSDIEKYLSADDKIGLINEYVSVQKAHVDYLEKVIKEIGNMGFHIKAIIEWRKFSSGA